MSSRRKPRADVELRRASTGEAAAGEEAAESRGDITKARLIDAAIASVAANGLEGTSVSRVSEHAGLSRGLVSFHFQGKDKLLEAALQRAIAIYEESWQRHVLDWSGAPGGRLHRAVDHDLDFAQERPEILALWWAAWGESRAKSLYRGSSFTRDRRFVEDLEQMFVAAGAPLAGAGQSAILLNASLLCIWLQHHLGERDCDLSTMRAAGHALVEALLAEHHRTPPDRPKPRQSSPGPAPTTARRGHRR